MRVGAYLYPWDVVGDPEAAEQVAALGVDEVAVAAMYHSTRAITARHPQHRVVVARHAAAYYGPDTDLWKGRPLRPATPGWLPGDSFGAAAGELHRVGLAVHAWLVLAHNARLGEEHPEASVENAYGDRYPWALCIAGGAVREYATTLVGEVAGRPDVDAIELEACGWYGFDHQSSHDKTAGVRSGAAEQFLLSLCFCVGCRRAYQAVGLDADRLRQAVRDALATLFAGGPPVDATTEWGGVERLLGTDTAAAVLTVRRQVGDGFRAEVIDAARAAARGPLPVLLQADTVPHRCGANVGVDAPAGYSHADGLVLSCWRDMDAAEAALREAAAAAGSDGRVVASFLAVAGMGGDPAALTDRIGRARAVGATDLRFYHAGLAGAADLRNIRSAVSSQREGQP